VECSVRTSADHLGIERVLPVEHLVPVADFVKSTFALGAKKRTAGIKLRAIDFDWSHGSGPEVTGPVEAIVRAMAGRKAALVDLAGEGMEILSSRS